MRRILIFLIFIEACNSKPSNGRNQTVETDNSDSNTSYPTKITDLKLQKWYDETKWALYCIYCDDTVKFIPQTGIKDTVTFASLDLKFEDVKRLSDTTEINAFFYLHDTLRCDLSTTKNSEVASGAAFKKGSDSIIYYTSTTTLSRFWRKGLRSRYETPLQPEVISYIKNNKENLHSWFYNEAKKRGVIQ